METHFEMYRDEHLQFRWRLTADNGRLVAHSGEAYRTQEDCANAIALTKGCSASEVRDATGVHAEAPTPRDSRSTIPRFDAGPPRTKE